MKSSSPSPALAVAIIATQLLGPGALWAAEQRGIRIDANRQIVVSALSGNQLTAGTKTLQFREAVDEGATLMTGPATTAELLIGNRAVVTLGHETTVQVRTVSADQTTIQVTKGMVRVAAAASAIGSQGVVTVQTPTSQVQTRGGILRVTVDASVSKAEHHLTGAQAYRTSYSPETMVAVANVSSDLIQVEEGTAEIPGVGSSGGLLTIKAGQRVTVQTGRAGTLAEAVSPGAVITGVLATTGHTQTPKEGRDYLVGLQVDQATKLGKALTGAAETGNDDFDKKKDTKNVINGATGGVTLQNTLVSALFGTGGAANPSASIAQERTGNGYGGVNSNGSFSESSIRTAISLNNPNSLLSFTRKDPIELVVKTGEAIMDVNGGIYGSGELCPRPCLEVNRIQVSEGQPDRVVAIPLDSNTSNIVVAKELVLIGGTPNEAHGGIAPKDTLIIRGLGQSNSPAFNDGFTPTDRSPSLNDDSFGAPEKIVAANNTFVVDNFSNIVDETISGGEEEIEVTRYIGGTLGQYSSNPDKRGLAFEGPKDQLPPASFVHGAITATTAPDRPAITLKGGVSLDQGTSATIGTTDATRNYFDPRTNSDLNKLRNDDARFSGSLLSVIRGPNNTPTVLTMQDRMLGVYDGSTVIGGDQTCTRSECNKALLSVLDAKLKGPGAPIPLIDIAAGTHFDRDGNATPGKNPNVMVTSAIVTRSTIQLDGALLEASAPLVALTQGTPTPTKPIMTTISHFADLAGDQAQSLNLNGALVALNAANLVIDKGHLLNLNNATAAISGYLFSLTNGSGLDIKNGALFSLNDRSSLTLTGDAFGVFGSGTNAVTIENNLCTGLCGRLVNSASQPITTLEGIPLMVSGVTQDVVLPNGFNAFALAPGATAVNAKIDIDANDALFHLDPTSTLTINGTKVK